MQLRAASSFPRLARAAPRRAACNSTPLARAALRRRRSNSPPVARAGRSSWPRRTARLAAPSARLCCAPARGGGCRHRSARAGRGARLQLPTGHPHELWCAQVLLAVQAGWSGRRENESPSEMARRAAAAALLLAVAVAAVLLHPAAAGQKKPATAARREDIPYIRCQVCERIAREISAQVAKKQQELPPSKKVPEIEIIDIAENVCNLKKQEADWMLRIDIVEKGDKLELVEQDEEGHCNAECKTIERACQEVMGYADTDVAEFVYKNNPSVDQLMKFLCKDLSKACAKDPPPVPKDRVPGEPFARKPSKDAEMEKILRSMEGMPGAPSMKMYSRDDLMKNNFGTEEDDDEDDEDEEDNFPKNLGKVLKDKGSQRKDLKQQVVQQFKDTSKKLKGHVNQMSKIVKKWWQGTKKPAKSGKSKTEL